ncbi:hypothetical protein GGD83_001864 [Rhodoblastus sphagnicola]|uniref:hypothetical protein n=1 Tax=Rhodoblastus sphagnicola TaxID=333368 RepID=UPI001304C2E2|nr:hypothetical protein [Rhodoblastus sphagnicola]MBB4198071.1 hypothetical protein [Rhodoblastus sphagnicola]
MRALDHVRQAEESLIIAIAKSNVPPEGGGQGASPEGLKQGRPAEQIQENGSTSRQFLN